MFPITLADVVRARQVLAPWLPSTPLQRHPLLDAELGLSVLVKHENHQPIGAFKVRNGIVAMSALDPAARARGVVAATRGNHGLGLAYAGKLLGISTTLCVPAGNNPEKNAGMIALGAKLVERGETYDDAAEEAERLVRDEGRTLVHSTENRAVLAGAATLSLELYEQAPALDAVVLSLGGGSQAVGAIVVLRELAPHVKVYAVQAANAPAQHDSIKAGVRMGRRASPTIADGLATGSSYALTFDALREGLSDVVLVSEAEIAEAMRMVMRTTHNLLEGAAAAPFAALSKLRSQLQDKTVAVVASGGNVDQATLRRVLNHEL
jgi:threonine dehydratase